MRDRYIYRERLTSSALVYVIRSLSKAAFASSFQDCLYISAVLLSKINLFSFFKDKNIRHKSILFYLFFYLNK